MNRPNKLHLGQFPTPMHRLDNMSRVLGRNIYIKRDDMTGVSTGGNKVRKLEYLLYDAKEKGADYVLTTGGAQSNHAMLTAACCNKIGIKAILVLKQRGVQGRVGNLLINDCWARTCALLIRTATTTYIRKWTALQTSCARRGIILTLCRLAAACRSARLAMSTARAKFLPKPLSRT